MATNGLAAAKTALINRTLHQIMEVINFDEVKNWENLKKILLWANVSFEEHSKTYKTKHFASSSKKIKINK